MLDGIFPSPNLFRHGNCFLYMRKGFLLDVELERNLKMKKETKIKRAGGEETVGKKLGMGLLVLALVGLLAGVSPAAIYDYQNVVGLNATLLAPGEVVAYQHTMPANFDVPPDILISANLDIYYQDSSGFAMVSVEGNLVGGVLVFAGDGFFDFDISSSLDPWTAGDPLDVSIASLTQNSIYLDQSVLTLKYDNPGTNDGTPVPEPSTLLLLGSGLLGIVVIGRKRAK